MYYQTEPHLHPVQEDFARKVLALAEPMKYIAPTATTLEIYPEGILRTKDKEATLITKDKKE